MSRAYGVLAAVRDVRQVHLGATGDHTEARGFVFEAVTAGAYHVTPEAAAGPLTFALAVGEAPTVAGLPVICVEVTGAANATILVGNF